MITNLILFALSGAYLCTLDPSDSMAPPAEAAYTVTVYGAQAEVLANHTGELTYMGGLRRQGALVAVTDPLPRFTSYRALMGTNRYGQLRADYRAGINAATTNGATAAQTRAALNDVLRLDRLTQARLAMQIERLQAGVKPEDED